MKGFEPSGFFVLRSPLLPFAEFESLAGTREETQERLRELVARPEVREAIFVASPALDDAMGDPEPRRRDAVERSLIRYVSRMASRPTPFGLFAGCSVGTVDEQTHLEVAPLPAYRRLSRLDMDYLDALARTMAADPSVRRDLTYRPSSSLHLAQGRWRFVQSRTDGKNRTHHLLAADDSPHLQVVIGQAHGGTTVEQLAKVLVGQGVMMQQAEGYVAELVRTQILVPDLLLSVTGPPAVLGLLEQLAGRPEAITLESVTNELAALDAAGVGGSTPARYRELAASLDALPIEVDLVRLFQVDMVKPAPSATLGKAVVEELWRGAELLHSMFPARPQRELEAFRDAFSTRFEEREVPLLEAVDDQLGVGFGQVAAAEAAPLLAGLALPTVNQPGPEWGPTQALLLRRVAEALSTGGREIVLQSADLENLNPDAGAPMADAVSVHGRVAAASEEALRSGRFLVHVEGFAGPSGAEMFGRFCHADPVLRTHVENHLRAEEALDPDVVFAEIVHLPEGRTGNILSRPVMREHEIVYLGGSGAPTDSQIPASDLLVSVRGGRVVLRSQRLGKQVLPRMTNAHSFRNRSVGVYKLLCLLQSQGVHPGASWDWRELSTAPFLPRVRVGRVILSLAQWHLDAADVARLTNAEAVQSWRTDQDMPRFFVLVDGDNLLTIDLDNVLCVESFVAQVKARESVTLRECWTDDLVARGPEGQFTHELIVPFVRPQPPRRRPRSRALADGRAFPPGSEWLYAKIYTGTATADRILLDVVRPVVRRALESGAADRWFFIRFTDPDPHLRLRFHGDPDVLRSVVLPDLQAALAADGRAWRVQLDTYEQETDRYGGPDGVAIAEQIFQLDSDAVVEILGMLEGDVGADERWRLALTGTAMLLDDLGLSNVEKLALCQQLRAAFAQEFQINATVRKQLSKRFRTERASLEPLLDPPLQGDHPLMPGFEVFRRRSTSLAPLVASLRGLDAAGQLSRSLPELAERYVHMHVNRLVRASQRAHELVLYDYLSRLLLSVTIRER